MLNQVMLVGRIANEIKLERDENFVKFIKLNLAAQRCYKNEEGIYETDIIPIMVFNNIAENVADYCRIGDLVGVKARIETNENKEIKLVADKLTFLSSKTQD